MKEYCFKEALAHLEMNPKDIFKRVNDEDFIIFRGHFGEIMYKIKGSSFARPLPYFNYTQDFFIKCEWFDIISKKLYVFWFKLPLFLLKNNGIIKMLNKSRRRILLWVIVK